MRKYAIFLIILFILIGLTGGYLNKHQGVFSQSPFNYEFAFEDISQAVVDKDGYLYVVNKEKQQITKLSDKATVQYQYKNMNVKSDFEYTDMVVDKLGALYVLKIDYFPYSEQIQMESILRFHPNGSFDKVIYSVEHLQEAVNEQTVMSLQLQREALTFFSIKNKQISLHTYHAINDRLQTDFIANQNGNLLDLYEIVGTSSDMIVYSTKRGELFTLINEKSKLLYTNVSEGIGRGVLEQLSLGAKNDLYFFDQHKKEIVQLFLTDSTEVIFLNKSIIERQGHSFPLINIKSVFKPSEGIALIAQADKIVVIDQKGDIQAIHDGGLYSQEHRLFHWWIWILPVLFIGLCLFTVRFIYIYLLNREISLVLKQVFLFLFLLSTSLGVISYIFYQKQMNNLEEEIEKSLSLYANLLIKDLDGGHLLKIKSPVDYQNESYIAMMQSFSALPKEIEFNLIKVQQGQLFTMMNGDTSIFTPVEMTNERREVLRGDAIYSEQEHVYISPLRDHLGEIVGQFELKMNHNVIKEKHDEFLSLLSKYLLFIGVIALLIFAGVTIYMFYPIRTLMKGVSEIAKGKWETAIAIHSTDEVAQLSGQVNKMSEHVRTYSKKMTDLNKAYYRFVPQLFLQYLGKDSVLDLQLGDQAEQEKTILIMKMRSFFSFTKNLTPEENFRFINSFLSRFSPIIQQNDGLVNKYIGAGALSFYPNDAKQAVESAIEMREALVVYNSHRAKVGYPAIDIGIGIHKGPIMLGVIGEQERLEGAVISDDVNITEVLERISETLGVSILVTQSVIQDLNNDKEWHYRSLGLINISERDEPLQLFDIYEGDIEDIYTKKNETKQLFENGIIMYQDGRFSDARKNFIEVIKHYPRDKTAKLYFYLCEEYYQKGVPKDWDGTLVIS